MQISHSMIYAKLLQEQRMPYDKAQTQSEGKIDGKNR